MHFGYRVAHLILKYNQPELKISYSPFLEPELRETEASFEIFLKFCFKV